MNKINDMQMKLAGGDIKTLARCITIIENELMGYEPILTSLQIKDIPVIGFTGPPGAGKSTLINSLLSFLSKKGKRIGVIAVDPTSPFNYGSLLGDRLRMSEHFNDKNIFIRSLATRGSLGGLSAKTIEVVDVLKAFGATSLNMPRQKIDKKIIPENANNKGFDYIFIETVGVGQTEVEVAGLADTTVLVLAPGFGDEIQTIKSGIMEIGDIFVVNKSDNPDADSLVSTIRKMIKNKMTKDWTPPIIKAIATQQIGIGQLADNIDKHFSRHTSNKRIFMLTEKAYQIIRQRRMKDLDKNVLEKKIAEEYKKPEFNLYNFVSTFA